MLDSDGKIPLSLLPGATDGDGDGYYGLPFGNDCNDSSSSINPGASEICDGIDNDCSSSTNEAGMNTGLCSLCGSGGNSVPAADDASCGTIDCDGRNYYYLTGTNDQNNTSYCN